MSPKPSITFTIILVCLLCFSAGDRYSLAKEPIQFNRDIRPILANHCFQCHGPDANAHASHHVTHVSSESDDASMSAACTLCQCVVNGADNALTPKATPVLQLSVAVIEAAVQVEWGDARIVAVYLSRGPPPISLD